MFNLLKDLSKWSNIYHIFQYRNVIQNSFSLILFREHVIHNRREQVTLNSFWRTYLPAIFYSNKPHITIVCKLLVVWRIGSEVGRERWTGFINYFSTLIFFSHSTYDQLHFRFASSSVLSYRTYSKRPLIVL